MDESRMEQRCNVLRKDLKAWEKKFALEHDGRKAGRDDIKADATISRKYKEYNKLRDVLAGKSAPQTPSKRTASREVVHDADKTPTAQNKTLNTTPLKRKRDSGVDCTDAADPAADFLSPRGPTMIGPTPQRDGIVLGLFDLLPPAETPSKRRAVLVEVVPNMLQTPRKYTGKAASEASLASRERREKTPLSSGKRFMLDKFVTPQKRRRDGQGSPTSALKGFSTPAFLRRDTTLDVVTEDLEATPRPAPWKRRGLGRSLSSMIQSLKQQEEDRLDEEAEIMREMELEAEGISVPKKVRVPAILVEDSQAAMPLGPDGVIESDDDEDGSEAQVGQNGRSGRVWKKRGQKRQTRRVIMRPNFARPNPQPTPAALQDHSESEGEVAETQLNDMSDQGLSDDCDDGSDYASDNSHTPKKQKTQQKKHKDAAKTQSTDKTGKKEGPVKTATRKIKATAHANYRKLKIKSKGGNGGKGRFGRRR